MANGLDLKRMLQAGSHWLEQHVQVVNGLNVFPVPDGDTGTNMALTMRAALQGIEQAEDQAAGTIAAAAARGALLGARGNSGVILSQFLQGIAAGLKDKKSFNCRDFAQAVDLGVQQAYQSVIQPVEGTMLTVARTVAEAAQTDGEIGEDISAQLARMVSAAREAQIQTPSLLPLLKEAGVTDSGGQGLVYILEGALQGLSEQALEPVREFEPGFNPALPLEIDIHRYDVQFLIQGEQLPLAALRDQLNRMGSSVLVVGDEKLARVHLHVDDPEQPLAYGRTLGRLSDVVVENMAEQARAFLGHSRPPNSINQSLQEQTAVVTVAAGAGWVEIFESLGVDRVVQGGPGCYPSALVLAEILEQIETEGILLLPNHEELLFTARQAGQLTRKNLRVVPTRSLSQGIAALLAFNHRTTLEQNARRMLEAAGKIVTIEISRATSRTHFSEIEVQVGDVLGLCNNQLGSVGQSELEVVLTLLARLEVPQYEVLTVYWGELVRQEQAEALSREIEKNYPDLALELYGGGQSYCHYIISLE